MSWQREYKDVFRGLDKVAAAVFGVLFLLYLASGVFVVEAGEMGVVFRFGAKTEVVPPGIGYHLPWPVGSVKKVNVKEVRTIEAGFWHEFAMDEELVPYCITGDKNIVHNLYSIKYRVDDPANFLGRGRRVEEILKELAQATILELVATQKVDPLLTTAKLKMEEKIKEDLEAKLLELGIKIKIVGVERKKADPPNLVKDAFQDVINAEEEKRTRIHEAENYRNQEIPKANGQAASMVQEAEAFKFNRSSAAKGESERFVKIFEEYKTAPSVTRRRLFIEMVEKTLPRTRIMVLATDKNGNPVKIKLFQAPVPTSPRLR